MSISSPRISFLSFSCVTHPTRTYIAVHYYYPQLHRTSVQILLCVHSKIKNITAASSQMRDEMEFFSYVKSACDVKSKKIDENRRKICIFLLLLLLACLVHWMETPTSSSQCKGFFFWSKIFTFGRRRRDVRKTFEQFFIHERKTSGKEEIQTLDDTKQRREKPIYFLSSRMSISRADVRTVGHTCKSLVA